VEKLGLSANHPEQDMRSQQQSGWRRFLTHRAGSELNDSEFRSQPHRPKRNSYRLVLGIALSILVVILARVVGKEVPPLLALVEEDLPSSTEQIHAFLAQLHIGQTDEMRPALPPQTHRSKRHVSR